MISHVYTDFTPSLQGSSIYDLKREDKAFNTIKKPELLKVADVQTHVCAKMLSISAKFVFLNTKQEKQAFFYDFGTI